MRVSIEIDASALKQIQKLTGLKKKSPAISQALAEFIDQQRKRAFLNRVLSEQTDYSLTNEELEARDTYETH